jgi:aspartyl-tRNA(Asn)/glutamyl-tRNA(Gln) amidotransferase subunit B
VSKLRDLLRQHNFSGIDPDTGERWMPAKIVEILGIRVYNDPDELRPIVRRVLEANPKLVEQYNSGKKKVLGRLLKEVFDETLDGADPQLTNKLLVEEMK